MALPMYDKLLLEEVLQQLIWQVYHYSQGFAVSISTGVGFLQHQQ